MSMKIALAQLNYIIGDFEQNTNKMLQQLRTAKTAGVDLIVFAELSTCAYPPRDFLEFSHFIEKCHASVEKLALECTGIAAIVGLPTVNPKKEGKNLYNSACVLQNGKITDTIHKALLPTYDIFDEYRYFEPNRNFHCVTIGSEKIALTICEDLWNIDDDPLYTSCPMDELIQENPSIIINIAASPFDYAHAAQRKSILQKNIHKYKLPLVYVNHVGAQTELIFDGGSLAFNRSGHVITEAVSFEESLSLVEFTNGDLHVAKGTPSTPSITNKYQSIHDALILGISDYFSKQQFKKAILGLSGGIDSAVVTYLAAKALGPQNVKVLLMPSRYSSSGSIDDSVQLVNNLGVESEIIPIEPVFDSFLSALSPAFEGLPANITEENLQARTRGILLMAQSNKFGSILLNTTNKSEMAVGYGTLYGDMCGGLSVIGDVYKTEVYELVKYINREQEIIPTNIITKAPSAELRPDQKDSDSLPDYEILDTLLYQYIEQRKGPDDLLAMGFDESLVRRVLKMVNTNEYKRHQTAPILRVSPKAFGSGRRMPIVAKYLS